MAMEVAVVRASAPTSSGLIDFAATGFGTPTAAIFYLTNTGGNADGTPNEEDAFLSVGFSDGGNDAYCGFRFYNVASSNGYRGQNDAYCIAQPGSTGELGYGTIATGAGAGFYDGGAKLYWNVINSVYSPEIVAVLIKGVSSAAGFFTVNSTQNAATSVSGLAFQPVALFTSCIGLSTQDSVTGVPIFAYGCAVDDGSDTQRFSALSNVDGSTVTSTAYLSTSGCCGQVYNGTVNWYGELTAWNSDGFSVTTRTGGSGGDVVAYLALSDGGSNLSLDTLTTPTATGADSIAVTGTPSAVVGSLTLVDTLNTPETSGAACESITAFAAADGSNEYSFCVGNNDGASNNDAFNVANNIALNAWYQNSGTPAELIDGGISSYASDALNLNYTTVDASARYGWIFVVSDSAAGVTLSIADATHAHTAATPTLTQAHVLTVADSEHAHTADNVVLSIPGALVVQDSTHAHTAHAVTLTQAHVLVVSNAAHTHTADAIALSQSHMLVISESSHSHAADNVTLEIGDTLGIQDTRHAQTADSLVLAQAHVLSIASATHAHLTDSLSLGTDATLVISDALHAHIAENCNVYEVDDIDTPPGRIFLIQREDRTFIVAAESRVFGVDSAGNLH